MLKLKWKARKKGGLKSKWKEAKYHTYIVEVELAYPGKLDKRGMTEIHSMMEWVAVMTDTEYLGSHIKELKDEK